MHDKQANMSMQGVGKRLIATPALLIGKCFKRSERQQHQQQQQLQQLRQPQQTEHAHQAQLPQKESEQQQQSVQHASLLCQLPSDIFAYRISPFLEDIDAVRCFRTCKYFYYHRLPKYHVKKAIDIATTSLKYPSFQRDSTRPIPIVERVRCTSIDELSKIKLNHKHFKSLRLVLMGMRMGHFNKLPNYLTELEIWNLDVQLIPNCLPPTLKHLKIYGIKIAQSFDMPGIFPAELESLAIGNKVHYEQLNRRSNPLQPNILPPTLKYLETNYLFENHSIGVNVLPSSLETLKFNTTADNDYKCYSQSRFPLNPGVLPSSLKILELGKTLNNSIDKDVLPQTLSELHLGDLYDLPIDTNMLPRLLKKLITGVSFNHPIELDVLPASLEELTFGHCFNHRLLTGTLPKSLLKLTFGAGFNQPLEKGLLPQSLRVLAFGRDFNQPIGKDVLPPSLKKLSFGIIFNQRIGIGILPQSLEVLSFHPESKPQIIENELPQSLRELYLPRSLANSLDKEVLPKFLTRRPSFHY